MKLNLIFDKVCNLVSDNSGRINLGFMGREFLLIQIMSFQIFGVSEFEFQVSPNINI